MAENGDEMKKRMSIREITEEIGRLYEGMKSLIDEAQGEGEPLAKEKEEQYNRMNSRLTDLISMRDQHYRLLDAQAAATRSVERKIETASAPKASGRRGEALMKFLSGEEYRSAFSKYLRHGLRDMTDAEQRAMTEGTDADGGYLPSTDFLSTLIEKRYLANAMRSVANIIPLGTFETEITIESSYPTAAYVAEADPATESSPTFSNLVLKPHTMRVFTKVSNELLADSAARGPAFNVESILARQFGKVMGEKEENKFVLGSGSSEPKGIFTYTSAGQISSTTAAGATSISIQNLLDVVAGLKRQYRANAKWVMTDAVFFKIRSMLQVSTVTTTTSGAAGGNYSPFAWSLGDGRLQDGEPDRLLGYPVVCVAQGNSIATGNVVAAFGDFSYFHIGEREGVSIKTARETYLANNQTGVFAFARNGSAATVYEAFQYLKMA